MGVVQTVKVAFGIRITAEEFESIKALVAPTEDDPETVMRAALMKTFPGVENSRKLTGGGLSYDLISADTPFEWVLGDRRPKITGHGGWSFWAEPSDPDYWDMVCIRTDQFRSVFGLDARPVGLFYGLDVG